MAVTGIRGVTGSLKRSIAYVTNPDKTDVISDEREPEECRNEPNIESGTVRYVAGINCSTGRVYEEMTAIREQYDRPGHNIAYHGYQSFRKGEVTPEEAFAIAKETARILWGRDYQVLVSVHTNTSHIHSHFLINSVSFTTHFKFENSKQDMVRLRTVSDRLCLFHGKSIVRHPRPNPSKNLQKFLAKGGRTLTDMMLDECRFYAAHTETLDGFTTCMYLAGYDYNANTNALRFPGHKKYTSLNRIPGLSKENLPARFNLLSPYDFDINPLPVYWPETFALQQYLQKASSPDREIGVRLLTQDPSKMIDFVVRSLQAFSKNPQCLSIVAPEFRAERKNLEPLTKLQELLVKEQIHTPKELTQLAKDNRSEWNKARAERNQVYQKMYHTKNPELKREYAAEYSEKKTKTDELSKRQQALEQLGKNPKQMLSGLERFSGMLTAELSLEKECHLEKETIKARNEARERAISRDRGYAR